MYVEIIYHPVVKRDLTNFEYMSNLIRILLENERHGVLINGIFRFRFSKAARAAFRGYPEKIHDVLGYLVDRVRQGELRTH